jgi:demethoxyubiquinone hydroxylase (CLK1/Coq7/Cat5 family)
MFKKNEHGPNYLTKGNAKELVETIVRTAVQEQARELEKHLADIDRRLRELESRR